RSLTGERPTRRSSIETERSLVLSRFRRGGSERRHLAFVDPRPQLPLEGRERAVVRDSLDLSSDIGPDAVSPMLGRVPSPSSMNSYRCVRVMPPPSMRLVCEYPVGGSHQADRAVELAASVAPVFVAVSADATLVTIPFNRSSP